MTFDDFLRRCAEDCVNGGNEEVAPAGRRARVLCGNCGVYYNAPEQEAEHGIGKCPTNLSAEAPHVP